MARHPKAALWSKSRAAPAPWAAYWRCGPEFNGRGRVLQFALWPARVTKPDRQNHKYKKRTVLQPLGLYH